MLVGAFPQTELRAFCPEPFVFNSRKAQQRFQSRGDPETSVYSETTRMRGRV